MTGWPVQKETYFYCRDLNNLTSPSLMPSFPFHPSPPPIALLDPSLTVSGERLENMSALSRTDTQLQPLLGVTPLGPMQLSQEKVYQLKMLEASCKHMPLPADSERVRYSYISWTGRFLCLVLPTTTTTSGLTYSGHLAPRRPSIINTLRRILTLSSSSSGSL